MECLHYYLQEHQLSIESKFLLLTISYSSYTKTIHEAFSKFEVLPRPKLMSNNCFRIGKHFVSFSLNICFYPFRNLGDLNFGLFLPY